LGFVSLSCSRITRITDKLAINWQNFAQVCCHNISPKFSLNFDEKALPECLTFNALFCGNSYNYDQTTSHFESDTEIIVKTRR